MKKIFYALTMVAFGAATLFSCSKAEENVVSNDDTIKITFGVDTRSSLKDALGLQWNTGDVIYWTGKGAANGTAVTVSSVSGDGYTASANVAAADILGTSGVFRYNAHATNTTEFEFTLHEGTLDEGAEKLTVTQTDAGEINGNIIMLQSGVKNIDIASDATTVTVDMQIAGSILRFLPYTTVRNTESVQSITFSSSDYLSGTVAYNYGAGSYNGVNGVNWKKIKSYTVNLTNDYLLDAAVSKETSKGIYMALPVNSISGYSVTVLTDVARYVFTSAKTMNISNNEVRNIYLNLEKASRAPLSASECKWQGIAQNTEYNAPDYHAYTAEGNILGFHEAWLKGPADAAFTNKPAPSAVWSYFYEPATFAVTDATTGEAVSWCSFKFRTNDSWIIPTCTENTSADSRKAKVVVTFPEVVTYDGTDYYVTSDTKTLVFYFTQQGKPSAEFSVSTTAYKVDYSATSVNIPVHAENAAWTATCSDSDVVLTGASGSADGTVTVSFPANTGAQKTYTVTISTTAGVDPNSYDVVITQNAKPDASAEWLETYSFYYNGIISDGLDAYLVQTGDTITITVPLNKVPNPFYMHFAHNDKVSLQNLGGEIADEEGHAGHRAAPYVDGADWTTPVWVASVGTHTIKFTAVGENGAMKTITLVVVVTED